MGEIDSPFRDLEAFLYQLNDLLAEQHLHSLVPDLEQRFATVHIIGAPRSGTTLMMQLVAASLNIAYPSNLAAMFWQAPCYGVALHRKLFRQTIGQNFSSQYGITDGPQGPHEFGRFWRALFNYPDMGERTDHPIDWTLVRSTLANMTETAGQAFAFKSFLPVWHLEELAHACPKSIFLHIVRDPLENALSLLQARHSYAKNETDWVGLKPLACKQYEAAPIAVQVVSQVIEIERAISARIETIPKNRVIRTTLREVCAAPENCIAQLADCIDAIQLETVRRRGVLPALEENFPSLTADPADISAVKKAFANFGHCL